jgi:hypothetical protein
MPACVPVEGKPKGTPGCFLATGKDGARYVGGQDGGYWCSGRAYDKDGKYLYTFFPPSAARIEEAMKPLSHPFATTTWGDKVIVVSPGSGFTPGLSMLNPTDKGKIVKALHHEDGRFLNLVTVMKGLPEAGEVKAVLLADLKLPAYKPVAGTASQKDPNGAPPTAYFGNSPRMAVDRVRDEIYICGPGGLSRMNGKTGERDLTWFPKGLGAEYTGTQVGEVAVGPDGNVYVRTGHFYYGQWLSRLDHEGKPAPFKESAVNAEEANKDWQAKYKHTFGAPLLPGITSIYTGSADDQCQGMSWGLFVSPNGNVMSVHTVAPDSPRHAISAEWMKKNGLVNADGSLPSRGGCVICVWDKDGKLLTPNAIYHTSQFGQGVAMDRDGNIYRHETAMPADSKGLPAGLAAGSPVPRSGSSLVKYRGRSGVYPIGTGAGERQKKGEWNKNPWILPEPQGLASGVDLSGSQGEPSRGAPRKCLGAQWAYGGMWTEPGCTCTNLRWDLDYYARSWLPSTHLFSVVVLDSNGNRIARLGPTRRRRQCRCPEAPRRHSVTIRSSPAMNLAGLIVAGSEPSR